MQNIIAFILIAVISILCSKFMDRVNEWADQQEKIEKELKHE